MHFTTVQRINKAFRWTLFSACAALMLFVFAGCEAGRFNPYDPESSSYQPPSGEDPPFQGNLDVQLYSEHYKSLSNFQDRYTIYLDVVFNNFPLIQSAQAVFFDTILFPVQVTLNPGLPPYGSLILLEDYLLGISVFEMIGHPPHLSVSLEDGMEYQSEGIDLIRIVEYTPETIYPDNFDLTLPKTEFQWEPADEVGYFHTFNLTVSFQFYNNIYYTMESLPADCTSIMPVTNLLLGDNVWWITLVDEFGNYSSSSKVFFEVSNEITP